jgi:hypothetical protein
MDVTNSDVGVRVCVHLQGAQHSKLDQKLKTSP